MLLDKIIGTFSNKLLATIASFLLVVFSSQILGASGKGEISLFIANIVFVQHIGNLISGTSLVYLTPRVKPILLLIPSYIWSVVSCVSISSLLWILGYVEDDWFKHLIILSTLYNLLSTNYMILLGREKVKVYNYLTLLVIIFTLGYFGFSHYVLKLSSPLDYVMALYTAYGFILFVSFISIRKEFTSFSFTDIKAVLNQMIKLGFTAQFSNIITFINYRFSYYILKLIFDDSVVGIFSVGIAISEAMWLMSKSIALIQYTKIVNEEDVVKSQKMTFKMSKLSFWITLVFVLVAFLLPDVFFSQLFGAEFIESKYVIYAMSLGIVSIAVSTTFSHYFGGVGKFSINNNASIVGLIFTIGLTYFMAKEYGMIGAGISASISYFASAVYLYFKFKKESNYGLMELIPTKSDFISLKKFIGKGN